jgi:HK97 family phage major capsid protein
MTNPLTLDSLRGRNADELDTIVATLETEARDLHARNAQLTDAEHDRLIEALDVRDEAIKRAEQLRTVADIFSRHPRASEIAFGGTLHGGGASTSADDVKGMGDEQVRTAALRVLETRGRDLAAEQGDRLEGMLRAALSADNRDLDGADLARRMLITESDAYRSAFQQIMTQTHPILTAEEAAAVRALQRLESRAMSEGSGPVGAYGLPVLIDPSVLLSSGALAAPILNACRIVPTNTNIWKGVASPPPTFSWDAEASVVSDDSPTLAQPSIPVYTMRGFLPYSIELGMDYPNFANEMAALLDAGYQDQLASTLAVGTGSSQPTGVFTKLDATSASEVRLTTAGQLGAVDVFKAWNALPERFRARASWVLSVSTESLIRSFSTPSSSSAYFTVDLTQEGISMINGRPVVRTDYAPTFLVGTTTSQNVAVVGDLKQYVLAQRIGLQVEPVPMLFQQQTAGTGIGYPAGQRGFFAYARAGADVAVPNALRILNQT